MNKITNLITGGAGFVGGHLCELLLEKGQKVIVFDNLSTGRVENLKKCLGHPDFSLIINDITSESEMDRYVRESDRIFHLAAAVGVQLIVKDPVRTIKTNILGSEIMLELAAKYGKKILLTSTSEVYGKSQKVPFAEEDDTLYGPTSKRRWAYAISKAVDEFLLLAYHESHGLPGIIVRLFNTVGPRQVADYGMVIPRMVQQALKGETITVYGDGEQKRCFTHVFDVVPALVKLMECDNAIGKVVNLGSENELSIMELANSIIKKSGSSSKIKLIPYNEAFRPGYEDMVIRVPDLTRASNLIGYVPRHSIDHILTDVIKEFKKGDRSG